MNFFKTGLQSVLGTNEVNESTTGAETVSANDFVLIREQFFQLEN
jgi:hypothetical protein